MYGLTNFVMENSEGEHMEKYRFKNERFHMHDPISVIDKHHTYMCVTINYNHEKNEAKKFKRRALIYEEVKDRKQQ